MFQFISLKGIAYIGSFRKSIEANIFKFEHIKRIGGTSAGAITAVLFGVGYTVDEAQILLEELKFGAVTPPLVSFASPMT